MSATPSPGESLLMGLTHQDPSGGAIDPRLAAGHLYAGARRVARDVIIGFRLAHNPADLEDEIFEWVFLRCWPTHEFRGTTAGEAYQFARQIAVFRLISVLRARRRRGATGGASERSPGSAPEEAIEDDRATPDEETAARELGERLLNLRVRLLVLAADPARPGRYRGVRALFDHRFPSTADATPVQETNAIQKLRSRARLEYVPDIVRENTELFANAEDQELLAALLGHREIDEPPSAAGEPGRPTGGNLP